MQNVFRVAILGSLVLIAAPAHAQQFSFMTGDRALQGYAPRATNDGYQAGGGGVPGQGPDLSNSPYQSGALGGPTGAQPVAAVTDQGVTPGAGGGTAGGNTGGGAAGGMGVMLKAPDQNGGVTGFGGPLTTRSDDTRTLDGSPGSAGGQGTSPPRVNPGALAGAGGNNVAIAGSFNPGAAGCPPMCGGSGGRASALNTGNQASIVTFGSAAAGGAAGGSGGGTAPYQFKFQAPQTQAFANLGPTPPAPPPINPPVVNIPSAARFQPVAPVTNIAPVANIQNLNSVAAGARVTPPAAVAGANVGMSVNGLKNLSTVNSVNNLMLNGRQKP